MKIYHWHLTLANMRITFDQMAVNTLLEHHRTPATNSEPQSAMDLVDAFLKTLDTASSFMTSDWGLPVHTLRALEVIASFLPFFGLPNSLCSTPQAKDWRGHKPIDGYHEFRHSDADGADRYFWLFLICLKSPGVLIPADDRVAAADGGNDSSATSPS